MKRLFSIGCPDNAFAFALLVLRLGAGALMMMNHGFDKLQNFSQKAGRFADPFHIGSTTSLSMVVFAEFFCAIFIIMGLFTRLACIPLIIAMAVAVFIAHNGDVFGKAELPALYLGCYVTLLFTGPGKISLDRFISK